MFVNLPITTVGSILTVFEFLLGIITARMLPGAIHGVNLLRLFYSGRLSLQSKGRRLCPSVTNVLGFLLPFLLLLAVFFFEYGISPSYSVGILPRETRNTSCVRLDNFEKQNSVEQLSLIGQSVPPSVRYERWAIDLIQGIGCNKTALSSVSTHLSFSKLGYADDILAPSCLKYSNESLQTNLASNISMIVTSTSERNYGDPLFDLIPYSLPVDENKESQKACREKGISSFVFSFFKDWEIPELNRSRLSNLIQKRLCQIHDDSVETIPRVWQEKCFLGEGNFRNWKEVNVSCIRDKMKASKKWQYRATLTNMSAVFVKTKGVGEAWACLNTSVRINYTFIYEGPDGRLDGMVLLPLSLESIGGTCERILHFFGHAALLHSAKAEWGEENDYVHLDRHERFRAMELVLAPIMLQPPEVFDKVTSEEQNCYLREVLNGTELPFDFRFGFLLIATFLCASASLIGLNMNILLRGKTWRVGTDIWCLRQVVQKKLGKDVSVRFATPEAYRRETEEGAIFRNSDCYYVEVDAV